MFNSNFLHNILNVAIVGLCAVFLASGCVTLPSGGLDCAASWISPQVTYWGVMFIGAAKLAMNFFRDGLTGMTKEQPPVVK